MKTRIISGAVGIALLAVLLLLRTTVVFNIALALVGALMSYELLRAEKLEKEYALLAAGALYSAACALFAVSEEHGGVIPYIAATFAYIVICQTVLLVRHKSIPAGKFFIFEGYSVMSVGCLASLAQMVRLAGSYSLAPIIMTCLGAWVADSGAYFAGTFLGKHKLCPEISPKKTVEGLIGGALANAVVFAVIPLFLDVNLSVLTFAAFALLGVCCCLLGLLGDLTASLIKRDAGIKDFGNIMPGHGGAVDRFDSLIYIAPLMLFITYMGMI